ncbi:uroporphyrinogen-III C-methyltransferase, partial [Pectobacterium versatile]|nr:uroporphyrinogen-III C-methyltransferase [Pectobacterium versatile]
MNPTLNTLMAQGHQRQLVLAGDVWLVGAGP